MQGVVKVDVLKKLECLSLCELCALDATAVHAITGTYDPLWNHGPHTAVRSVYQTLKLDLEDGITPLPIDSRALALWAVKRELSGRDRAVYSIVVRAAIDPKSDLTMADCRGN